MRITLLKSSGKSAYVYVIIVIFKNKNYQRKMNFRPSISFIEQIILIHLSKKNYKLIRRVFRRIIFTRSTSMRIRYDMKKLPTGSWCVYDIITGAIAKYNGKEVVGLNIVETDCMVDRLNMIHCNGFSRYLH